MNNPAALPNLVAATETLRKDWLALVARESSLRADHAARQSTARRRADSARTQSHADAQAARDSITRQSDERFARIESFRQSRLARLARAVRSSRKSASDSIDRIEGRDKFRLQKDALNADKLREASLNNAITAAASFRQRLADIQHSFASLESSAVESFAAFPGLKRLLRLEFPCPVPDLSPDEHTLLQQLADAHADAALQLRRARSSPLTAFFRIVPVWILLPAALAAAAAAPFAATRLAWSPAQIHSTQLTAAAIAAASLLAYAIAYLLARSPARRLALQLGQARHSLAACAEKNESRLTADTARFESDFKQTTRQIGDQWEELQAEVARLRQSASKRVESKHLRASQRWERLHQARLDDATRQRSRDLLQADSESASRLAEIDQLLSSTLLDLQKEADERAATLQTEWRNANAAAESQFRSARTACAPFSLPWSDPAWSNPQPAGAIASIIPLARWELAPSRWIEPDALEQTTLAPPAPEPLSLPIALTLPDTPNLAVETPREGMPEVIHAFNVAILRSLAHSDPGKLSISVFDPAGLGQNFPAVTHLADHENSPLAGRICTQPSQIESRLGELCEHIEKIIQMYLRNEFATLIEFNQHAGVTAEKFHLLVIAGFPFHFTEVAIQRLLKILTSGPRCGIAVLLHWDPRSPMPPGLPLRDLLAPCIQISYADRAFKLPTSTPLPGARIQFDLPPDSATATAFFTRIGQLAHSANRIEVPFSTVAPSDDDLWSDDTSEDLRVPIGKCGANKLQFLALGRGTRQHVLIAGKTGSGKSTLLHALITNLALRCSPDQVEFYLIDFKKGVEFKAYATRQLPHARVIAIESDRQFALSVLERVDEELRRRGDLFRLAGVNDLAHYRRSRNSIPLPRSLLIIDEFQEYFVEDDRISQSAAVLLDRIVRQGRAFGIHVILGSQTLGGAYTLARATLGQMVVRIALQCSETDAHLIMDENNTMPRLLSRPGEGIYNDASGAPENNSPFQTVWINDEVRDAALLRVLNRSNSVPTPPTQHPAPFVFEGNAPSRIEENPALQSLLTALAPLPHPLPRVWLGAPNSIKGPTELQFARQSGQNLLVVGQRDEASTTLLAIALLTLAAQHVASPARFILLDSSLPESPQHKQLLQIIDALPQPVERPKPGDLATLLTQLAQLIQQHDESPGENSTPVYFFIHGLQNFKKLRPSDDYAFGAGASDGPDPASLFATLIAEGAARGLHLLVTCDSFNNVTRFLNRKALAEFEKRVLFQMSAGDSASLIDDPAASNLGLFRALSFDEREGTREIFRPYASPDSAWIDAAASALARLAQTAHSTSRTPPSSSPTRLPAPSPRAVSQN